MSSTNSFVCRGAESGEVVQDDEGKACLAPEMTLSQQLQTKGWSLKTYLEGQVLVTQIETQSASRLTMYSGLTCSAIRALENAFKDVVPFNISPASISQCGVTMSWVLKVSGADSYARAFEWLEETVASQTTDEPHGVFKYTFTTVPSRITWAEYCEMDSGDEEDGLEVTVSNERQILKLESRGFEKIGENTMRKPVLQSTDCALDVLIQRLTVEFKNDSIVPPKKEVVAADTESLTPLKALALDLNSLGPKLKDFGSAGGKPRSLRALSKVSGWMPTGKMHVDVFFEKLLANVRREGRLVYEGYTSDRDLALGVMATRKSQITVDGDLVEYRGVPQK